MPHTPTRMMSGMLSKKSFVNCAYEQLSIPVYSLVHRIAVNQELQVYNKQGTKQSYPVSQHSHWSKGKGDQKGYLRQEEQNVMCVV